MNTQMILTCGQYALHCQTWMDHQPKNLKKQAVFDCQKQPTTIAYTLNQLHLFKSCLSSGTTNVAAQVLADGIATVSISWHDLQNYSCDGWASAAQKSASGGHQQCIHTPLQLQQQPCSPKQ